MRDRSIPLDSREAFEWRDIRRRERQRDEGEDGFDDRLDEGFAAMQDDDIDDDDNGRLISNQRDD